MTATTLLLAMLLAAAATGAEQDPTTTAATTTVEREPATLPVRAKPKVYYVATDGNDDNSGLSKEKAWRTITHAAAQARAGDTVKIKGGNYGHEHVIMCNSGTADRLIVFKGYSSEAVMEGHGKGEERGILIDGKAYIRIGKITLKGYKNAIVVKNSHHITIERTTTKLCKWAGIIISSSSHDCIVRNCTAHNNDMVNIVLGGNAYNNTVEDCYCYTDPALPLRSDYGIGISAGGHHNLIRNCKMGAPAMKGGGHGVCLTGPSMADKGAHYNTIENCIAYNWNEGMGARDHSSHNVFRNCTVINSDPAKGYRGSYIGFYLRNVSDTTLVNCRAVGYHEAAFGIKSTTSNTLLKNCIAEKFNICGFQMAGKKVTAINCTAANWAGQGEGRAFSLAGDSVVRNCIAAGNKYGCYSGGSPTIVYCNVWNNRRNYGSKASPGAGCISKDPLFADSASGDFHLRSKAGRWNPKSKKWIRDAATSPCINAGSGGDKYSNEPAPNGGRINMGAYGNTARASKSASAPKAAATQHASDRSAEP